MIAHCRERQAVFGISSSQGGAVSSVGCTVEIARVTHEYTDGRLDILTVGRQRYRMIEAYQDLPYLTASVDYFDDVEEEPEPELLQEVVAHRARFFELMGEPGWSLEEQEVPGTAFALTRGIDLDVDFKQKLLESTSENQRLGLLCAQFEQLLPEMAQHKAAVRQARSNGKPKGM